MEFTQWCFPGFGQAERKYGPETLILSNMATLTTENLPLLTWFQGILKDFKTESIRKLSNFNFSGQKPCTRIIIILKISYSFFTFFKGQRHNKSSVVTPKKISHGSPRKWKPNFTRIVITQVKFWKSHV